MSDTHSYSDIFRHHLSNTYGMTMLSWQALEPLLNVKSAKKHQLIVKENQNYQNEIFLVSGIVRLYYLGPEGEEINIAFYKGIETIRPLFTRTINDKHTCYIEAITDLIYITFNAEEFSKLIRSKNDVQQYAYQIVEKELRYNIEREKQQLSQNAQQRLEAFRNYYKGLENEIPHYHIASYLGISPVSLSRLRKQNT